MLTTDDLKALQAFTDNYPTWWYQIGFCQRTRDFSCAPEGNSPEIKYIKKHGDCWDAGFHCDHNGTVADAINHVMGEIAEAENNHNHAENKLDSAE